MTTISHDINEHYVEKAFSSQSVIFDDLYAANAIVSYKRERVRAHVLNYLKPGGNILELNSGTGEDALYFAAWGHKVHATDISAGMQQRLQQKVKAAEMQQWVSAELCSFTQLNKLENRGPYDQIFSNFAGLNCTGDLADVLASLPNLLSPGGVVTLVILPKFCLWETLLVFKGKFRTAFRRFFSKNGRKAHLEGTYFKCWYYDPSYLVKSAAASFDLLSIEGLCTFVPPSYIEGFAEKYPVTFRRLRNLESRYRFSKPWRSIGDYYIISFRKK